MPPSSSSPPSLAAFERRPSAGVNDLPRSRWESGSLLATLAVIARGQDLAA